MTGAEHDPVTLFAFAIVNVTITVGYLWLSVVVLPNLPLRLARTKIGGVGFFLLCGLTHTHMAVGVLIHPQMSVVEMATSWLSLAIHVPQAVCVWMFVTGMYIEIGYWGFVEHGPRSDPDT